jgi:DNA primase
MNNPHSIFDYIKSNVPIMQVVQEYITLKKIGLYWKSCCPFHQEKTASFTVSPNRNMFYCFGCQASGDCINFVAKMEHCLPLEAAYLIVERHKITLPDSLTQKTSATKSALEKNYYEIWRLLAQWCHQQLGEHKLALHYILSRGFDQESIKKFLIGYFPGGMASQQKLLRYMHAHNILAHDLIDANVIQEGRKMVYSAFENRVMFPIKDHMGRFCGSGGRTIAISDDRPKYYNTKEHACFDKGSVVFGLDIAKKKIQETGQAFLVEGYTDCIAMVQHGYLNTVATLGTACTAAHLQQIARYAHHLYVMYDGDKAGIQATLRLVELCWNVNIDLYVVVLPAGKDPAMMCASNEDLASLICQAHDIFMFFIERLSLQSSSKSTGYQLNAIRSLLVLIQKIPDPLKRELLLQKAAKSLNMSYELLRQEVVIVPPARDANTDTVVKTAEEPSLLETIEKKIFCAIINNTSLLATEGIERIIDYLPSPLQGVITQLKKFHQLDAEMNFVRFFETLNDSEKQLVGSIAFMQENKVDLQHFNDLLNILQRKQWKAIVYTIRRELKRAQASGDRTQVEKIVRDFDALKKKMVAHS